MKMRLRDIAMVRKLSLLFLLLGLAPLVISAGWSGWLVTNALLDKAFAGLETVRGMKKYQIEAYFADCMRDVEILSKSSDVHLMFRELVQYHIDTKVRPDGPYDVTTSAYRAIWRDSSGDLANYMKRYGYYDIFIICAKHGHVMYSAATESDLGTNLVHGPYRESGLARLWSKVVERRAAVFEDFSAYAPSNGEPAAFIGHPVFNESGEVVAVAALQLAPTTINAIMNQRDGMGKSGEAYLVGPDLRMRSDSFLDPVNHSLAAAFSGSGSAGRVDTEASRAALAGQPGSAIIVDYEGHEVLSSYTPVQAGGTTWALIAEMEKKEVRQPVIVLLRSMFTVIVAAALGLVFVSLVVARQIAGPLSRSMEFADRVAAGDLAGEIHLEQEDEAGQLARALNVMVGRLREMMADIEENSRRVAGASDELSALSRQMASGAEELSARSAGAAVVTDQISGNMENLATVARGMNDKSAAISTSAGAIAENITTVAAAVEEMTASIGEVSQNCQRAAELAGHANELSTVSSDRMGQLDRAAADIGNVINIITDIAEQTKLLALNATIEAARAGEAGKGFAVVANEVKELARQTATATGDISRQIGEMQSQTGAVVTNISEIAELNRTINEINSAIAAAIEEQSSTTGEIARSVAMSAQGASTVSQTIRALSVSIEEEVSGTVDETSRGIGEVAAGIHGVSDVARDTALAAEAIRTAAAQLADLAGRLQEQTGRFRLH